MSAAGGEVEVGVPNSMVGMLIGKEGASLAALRKESGARIKITLTLILTLTLTLTLTLALTLTPNTSMPSRRNTRTS